MQNPNSNPEIPYFEKIDVIRFFAAIMVVVFHAYQSWVNNWHHLKILTQHGDEKTLTEIGELVHTAFMNGDYGVELFFIISGFLITYLLLKEKENNKRINFLKFYTRRALKIWPLYFLIVFISPLLVKWMQQENTPDYISHLLFYSNLDSMHNRDNWVFPLSHFWSLCIEEHFYLVWPFIIAFIPNKHLLKIFVALIVLSIIYRGYEFVHTKQPWFYLYLSTFSRFDSLVAGAIAAYIHFKKPIKYKVSRTVRYLVLLIFVLVFFSNHLLSWDSVYSACFKKYFYLSIVMFLILNYLFNQNPLFEFMNNRVIRYLGKISYGIYVYGLLVFEIITQKIMKPYGYDNIYVYWSLVLSCSILIPIISYELFEKPILKFKKRFEVVRVKQD